MLPPLPSRGVAARAVLRYVSPMAGCLSLYCFLVFGPPGLALDAGPTAVPQAPGSSIQAYGRTRACSAWTDGCTICTGRGGETPASCSTPGIACTPTAVVCTAP